MEVTERYEMMRMSNMSSVITLNNGVPMPILGLGVYKIPPGSTTEEVVLTALSIGYRLIDTAALYGNEKDVGRAIMKSCIPRKEVFVTTKLHPTTLCRIERAFDGSLRTLGLEYMDLFLIHVPTILSARIWKVLERIYRQGRARAIGVSNFTQSNLQRLLQSAEITPAVNQVEFHPFLYNEELLEYSKAHDILTEAHSPLTHGKRLHAPRLLEIARTLEKSPAQILIRWVLQHGLIAIPKALHVEHLRENMGALDFEIPEYEMKQLDALNEGYHAAWLSRLAGRFIF